MPCCDRTCSCLFNAASACLHSFKTDSNPMYSALIPTQSTWGHNFQATMKLLAAVLLNPDVQPVILLTDFNNKFRFFYMDGTTIYIRQGTDKARGWALVRAVLKHSNAMHSGSMSALRQQPPRMARHDQGTGTPSILGKRKPFELETMGGRASGEGGGDVANLGDLEGMLDPQELNEARMQALLQLFAASGIGLSILEKARSSTPDNQGIS
eukprot:TRINITY_DN5349_c0_g2_i3.p1 TRINITY_DN5349_c0_g2~~TRINITY_DN5349_c0_g2_i3.p1  ORF type:complete len:211 (+),score=18.91 TRINITY_DN5349_c0_g2_i3:587-1219(+)